MNEGDQRPRRLVIRPRARQDIADTLAFTERRWGKGQRTAYRAILLGTIDELRRSPERGRRRDDVFPGCRSILAGTHMIYYRVAENGVLMLRVLHTSQNVDDETEF